jgi:hypothetical protein
VPTPGEQKLELSLTLRRVPLPQPASLTNL